VAIEERLSSGDARRCIGALVESVGTIKLQDDDRSPFRYSRYFMNHCGSVAVVHDAAYAYDEVDTTGFQWYVFDVGDDADAVEEPSSNKIRVNVKVRA
jgi:hypothetical protein